MEICELEKARQGRGLFPPIPGFTTEEELGILYHFASLCTEVVEVGRWKGRSTQALLMGCRGTVYSVDHFKGSTGESDITFWQSKKDNVYDEFIHNVGHYSNLVVLKGEGLERAKQFDNKSVDMVFLDGDHEYSHVLADLKAWMPKVRKFLVGHDLEQGGGGVKQALQDLKIPFMPLNTPLGLWFFQI